MRRVFSSHVELIGYDEETRELHVTYRDGRTAIHAGVPPRTAGEVLSSPSIGTALWSLIRGKYTPSYAPGGGQGPEATKG
jgi:hypothetical protein